MYKLKKDPWKVGTVELIRGRKEPWVLPWGGSPDPGGSSEREGRKKVQRKKEREREPVQGTAQENYFTKPLTGKKENVTTLPVFYKPWSTESEVSEFWDTVSVEPERCSGGEAGWRPSSRQPEHPQGHTGRSSSPAWSAFGRSDTASPPAKDPMDIIELPCLPV